MVSDTPNVTIPQMCLFFKKKANNFIPIYRDITINLFPNGEKKGTFGGSDKLSTTTNQPNNQTKQPNQTKPNQTYIFLGLAMVWLSYPILGMEMPWNYRHGIIVLHYPILGGGNREFLGHWFYGISTPFGYFA